MIKVRKRSGLKRFASEDQVDQLSDVIDVNVVDEEGNPLEESELSEEQIKFAAKVAMRVYKKFAKSKKVMFDSEEDQITVTVPDDIPVDPEEMREQVEEAVEESIGEFNEDPDEVSIEVTETPEDEETEVEEPTEVETTEETIETEEPETEKFAARKRNKKFSKAGRKTRRFSAEDLEEAEETEEELEKEIEDMDDEGGMPEEEGADTLPEEPKENTGTRSFSSKKNRKLDIIDRALGSDGVTGFKQKFFSSNR